MADIRIKDLTTTASSTASDDFIAVDGTTNGTRKLNAFSPTFGGNATVTGTLSSAGNLSVTGTSAQIILGQSSSSQLTYLIRPAQAGGAIQMVQDSATINRWLSLGGCDNTGVYSELMRVAGATGNILVTSTVASTTTSTGALVVGNGTSGGLGVGGSANIQGNLTLGYASAGDSVLKVIRSSGGNEWLQIAGWSAGSLGNNAYSIDAVNGASARPVYFRRSTDAGSTYSTFLTWDTSNNATFGGAVTVSVGNGVAATLGLNQTGVANAYLTQKATSGDLALGNGGGDQLTIAKTTGNATLVGSLTTGADTSLVAIYIPGDSALRAAAGKMYLDTRVTDGGDIVLRPRTNAALTLAAATGNATFASTTNASSTSFAALVVNGGVGVGKRIVSGEGLTTNGDNDTHISFVRNGTVSIGPTSSAAPKLSISSAVVLAAATQSLTAWGDIGAQFAVSGSVLTDTQSSGTVSRCVLNSFASTNVAAAGATTFTQAATLFVAGGPTAGTNVTITNAYAIYTAGGRINFQGLPTSSAGLQAGTLWNDSGTLKVA